MTTDRERIVALEAQVARLTADRDAFRQPPTPARPAPPPPPNAYVEPRATVVTMVPGFRFVMPSEQELRRLHEIVLESYPMLEEKLGRFDYHDVPFNNFVAAFRAVGMTGRTAEPEDRIGLSFYVDFFNNDLLRPAGAGTDATGNAIGAAVVAHGDISFRPFEQNGWSFGLAYRVNSGRPATDAWRHLLETGKAPDPTHPLRTFKPWSEIRHTTW